MLGPRDHLLCIAMTAQCQEWGRYPTGAQLSVRSGAGTPQVPSSVSGVVQVPHRCPAQCQEWCRYPTGALLSVRSGAGTPQEPCPVSGVVQVPHRCPAQCQEWCSYPTGALPSVRSGAEIVLLRLRLWVQNPACYPLGYLFTPSQG